MTVKQVKEELAGMGLSSEGCVDRHDLDLRLLEARGARTRAPVAEQTRAGRRAVAAMINEAISIGVPIYNDGDPGACADVYRECCADILELGGGLDADCQRLILQVLSNLPSLPSDDARAWALREVLDAVAQAISQASAAAQNSAGKKKASAHASSEPDSALLPASSEPKESMLGAGEEQFPVANPSTGVSAQVQDDGWDGDLACSICLEFLWDPVKLTCAHYFCRCCILRTTRLSPDGKKCPQCRAAIDIDPDKAPADADLQRRVDSTVPAHERQERSEAACKELADLRRVTSHTLPVFVMAPGTRPGERVQLNLFEERYTTMARRIMAIDGNNLFVFASSPPSSGSDAALVLVQVPQALNP
jgi:hypothetical protein